MHMHMAFDTSPGPLIAHQRHLRLLSTKACQLCWNASLQSWASWLQYAALWLLGVLWHHLPMQTLLKIASSRSSVSGERQRENDASDMALGKCLASFADAEFAEDCIQQVLSINDASDTA